MEIFVVPLVVEFRLLVRLIVSFAIVVPYRTISYFLTEKTFETVVLELALPPIFLVNKLSEQ